MPLPRAGHSPAAETALQDAPLPRRPREPRKPPGRFADVVNLSTGWIVVLLVAVALAFVERVSRPGPPMRVLWYLLLIVAVVRALHRSVRFVRGVRGPRGR